MGCARRGAQGHWRFGGRVDRQPTRLANLPGRESAEQRWFRLAGLDKQLARRNVARADDSGVSRMARRRPPVAPIARCRRPGRPLDRHAGALIIATLVAAVLLSGCRFQEGILSDEPFRMAVPDNAELLDEVVDDGSSLIKDGERSVLRRFAPVSPAEPVDVLEALVAEGEATGWEVVDRSPSLVVARKEVEGRQWTASVSIEGDRVRQLLAGR